jgi:Phosphoenolpyruvate phosphomutase
LLLSSSSSAEINDHAAAAPDHDEKFAAAATSPPDLLRRLLQAELDGSRQSLSSPILLPCCYDGLTARLVARYQHHQQQQTNGQNAACFEATFLTGFGTSAVYGYPDTQLVSYEEMVAQCRTVSAALASVAMEQQQQQTAMQNDPTTTNNNTQRQSRRRYPIPCIAVRISPGHCKL